MHASAGMPAPAPAPLPLQRKAFSTVDIVRPAIFKALALCRSLTKLEVAPIYLLGREVLANLCASLGLLTTRQSLKVWMIHYDSAPFLPDCLAA